MKDKSIGHDGNPKWFTTEEKANGFIEKKKLGDTHHAKDNGAGKWEILPKDSGDDS